MRSSGVTDLFPAKDFDDWAATYDETVWVNGGFPFADQTAQEQVRTMLAEDWEEEFYWIAADAIPALKSAGLEVCYHPVSFCAGVFTIRELSS